MVTLFQKLQQYKSFKSVICFGPAIFIYSLAHKLQNSFLINISLLIMFAGVFIFLNWNRLQAALFNIETETPEQPKELSTNDLLAELEKLSGSKDEAQRRVNLECKTNPDASYSDSLKAALRRKIAEDAS